MNILLRWLVIGSAFLFLGLSDDPNEKADEVYAQAAQLVESAKQAGSYSEALPLYEQARDMLERIVSQYVANTLKGQKAPALMTLAGELTKAGQAEQAGPILTQALDLTNALKDGDHKAQSLVDIVRRLTEAGQAEQARSILSQALNVANTVKDDYWKAWAVANIVGELTEASQFTQALASANTIKEADDKDSAVAASAPSWASHPSIRSRTASWPI